MDEGTSTDTDGSVRSRGVGGEPDRTPAGQADLPRAERHLRLRLGRGDRRMLRRVDRFDDVDAVGAGVVGRLGGGDEEPEHRAERALQPRSAS